MVACRRYGVVGLPGLLTLLDISPEALAAAKWGYLTGWQEWWLTAGLAIVARLAAVEEAAKHKVLDSREAAGEELDIWGQAMDLEGPGSSLEVK